MDKKSYFKGLVSGVLIVLLTTNIVFAASSKSIKVTFDNIRMIFDGVEKKPASDSKPITYNGKIYVPLDFTAKSMGKNYTWDSKNKTAYIGLNKNELSNNIVVAKTSDGSAQLTFPKGWKDTVASNPSSILLYSNIYGCVAVIRDSKNGFSSDLTLDDYTSMVTNHVTPKMENPVVTGPITTSINNYSAQQFEIQGELQKVKFKYLYTIIESSGSYYQIIAYTTLDLYDKQKSIFVKIANTFKEIKK